MKARTRRRAFDEGWRDALRYGRRDPGFPIESDTYIVGYDKGFKAGMEARQGIIAEARGEPTPKPQ